MSNAGQGHVDRFQDPFIFTEIYIGDSRIKKGKKAKEDLVIVLKIDDKSSYELFITSSNKQIINSSDIRIVPKGDKPKIAENFSLPLAQEPDEAINNFITALCKCAIFLFNNHSKTRLTHSEIYGYRHVGSENSGEDPLWAYNRDEATKLRDPPDSFVEDDGQSALREGGIWTDWWLCSIL